MAPSSGSPIPVSCTLSFSMPSKLPIHPLFDSLNLTITHSLMILQPHQILLLGIPCLQFEQECLWPGDEQARIVVSWDVNLLPVSVPFLRNIERPRHASHTNEQLLLDEIHPHADASSVPE